jgi:hypothetical protein
VMLMSTNETGAGGVFDLCPHRGMAMDFTSTLGYTLKQSYFSP